MIMEPVLGWVAHRRGTLTRYGQRPATLWDIRLSMIASQIGLMALAALILWAIL